MKTIVIYHRADFDGIFCREIARKFLPDAELIGWDYSDPAPAKAQIDGTERLYLLDISVPDLMDHPNLVWIDHHRSAMEKFGKKVGYQIDGVAACRLAWQWFSLMAATSDPEQFALPDKQHYFDRQVQEPLAVRLAGEYDIWDRRDPNAELFQHGLRGQELDSEIWSHLLRVESLLATETVVKLLEVGRALQYAKAQENASIIKDIGFDLDFEGLKFLACNAARYNSLLFTSRLRPYHDACFGFKWTGKNWSVSLYHAPGKEHHDLSKIAVKYGGGGHRGACGFLLARLPFGN